MNLQELRERTKVKRLNGYCSYEITVTYRGKNYTCHSNNSLAWDRIQESYMLHEWEVSGTYTEKQAYESLYNECKRKNNLK